MDLFERLGPAVGAEFASKRDSLPKAFIYSEAAHDELADCIRGLVSGNELVLVADCRTQQVAGLECRQALERAGWTVRELLVPDSDGGDAPVCDEHTHDWLLSNAPAADMFLAVGSGVINDLSKWVAAERGVPYAVMATAASMNGYTAANVAPMLGGVKGLFRAKAPIAVAAIPHVIEQAPYRLTTSGLGDVIAKPVSTADWVMNHMLSAEPYSESIARLIDQIEPGYLNAPEALRERQASATRALFEALILSGCAMTLQGSSLPASGGEHLVSHALDMLAHIDGAAHDLHGRQVGVATIFAAELYRRALRLEGPRLKPESILFDGGRWGSAAAAVAVEYEKKRSAMWLACQQLSDRGRWDSLRAALLPRLRTPESIRHCLQRAGAAWRIADLGIEAGRFKEAVRLCGAIRGRFTSIDLAYAVGVLPGALDEIVEGLG